MSCPALPIRVSDKPAKDPFGSAIPYCLAVKGMLLDSAIGELVIANVKPSIGDVESCVERKRFVVKLHDDPRRIAEI